MANWQAIIGIVAGLIGLLGFVPYIITAFQGKTRPNRASWWIWGILGVVLGISYYCSGASNSIWVPVCFAISQLVIAIISLRHGEGGWNRLDRMCLLGVGVSLMMWWLFNSPLAALLFTLLIDFLGALPTIKKSYLEPEQESWLSWALFLTANTLNLLALENWQLALSAYPFYLFCLSGTITFLLVQPKLSVLRIKYKRRRRIGRLKLNHYK
ncbi:MAG: hypothetical protein WCA35_16435 [Kovacikia sp.]